MQPGLFSNSIKLFTFRGIRVSLHWTWFLAAAILVQMRVNALGVSGWEALGDVVGLFSIVLLHEFGHALACKSVGGIASRIVLMPLGGVAFVQPPPRPGAVLWSIVAGPLVNVLLVPVTVILVVVSQAPLVGLGHWASTLFVMNIVLFCFNMLPIYPLDGGQIVMALLWFVIGRAKALRVTAAFGLAMGGVGLFFSLSIGSWYYTLMAGFLMWNAWGGYRAARALAVMEQYEKNNAWPVGLNPRQYNEPWNR